MGVLEGTVAELGGDPADARAAVDWGHTLLQDPGRAVREAIAANARLGRQQAAERQAAWDHAWASAEHAAQQLVDGPSNQAAWQATLDAIGASQDALIRQTNPAETARLRSGVRQWAAHTTLEDPVDGLGQAANVLGAVAKDAVEWDDLAAGRYDQAAKRLLAGDEAVAAETSDPAWATGRAIPSLLGKVLLVGGLRRLPATAAKDAEAVTAAAVGAAVDELGTISRRAPDAPVNRAGYALPIEQRPATVGGPGHAGLEGTAEEAILAVPAPPAPPPRPALKLERPSPELLERLRGVHDEARRFGTPGDPVWKMPNREANDWIDQHFSDAYHQMRGHEREALRDWTSEAFRSLQRSLRRGDSVTSRSTSRSGAGRSPRT